MFVQKTTFPVSEREFRQEQLLRVGDTDQW